MQKSILDKNCKWKEKQVKISGGLHLGQNYTINIPQSY